MDLLTRNEVAKKFRVTRATIARWDKTGALPSVRLGRKVLFRADDIERLILQRLKGNRYE